MGTASVEESEQLSRLLQQAGVPHHTLNAKTHDQEAAIIEQAGALGAVTVSTNMAGRGTDIRLGGKNEHDRDAVVALGGLYVIGTNRHESRRVDNQLRGRAGRQGDPGESRFFISLEDDLLVRYGIKNLISSKYWPKPQDNPVEHFVINREVARAQRIVEGQNFEIRKTLWKYANLTEHQRQHIHQWRQDVLCDPTSMNVCATKASERYEALRILVDGHALQQAEQQITLFHIDRCWADYIAYLGHIRDGIHLVSLSGERPLDEFHKVCAETFPKLLQRIEDEIVATFEAIEVTERRIAMGKIGLRGPSSTWTYQLNDTPFANQLQQMLIGNQNIAFAGGGALMLGPFLILWGLWQRFRKRKNGDKQISR